MNSQTIKQVKEIVDDIIHNVSVDELEKAKLLLETLRTLLTIEK